MDPAHQDWLEWGLINTLKPRQNGCHFPDDTFKRIFMNENVKISTNISLKFVPKGLINNIPALAQIMAWHRPGDKPLSDPMTVNLLTHICVTRPQWVKQGTVKVCIKLIIFIHENIICFGLNLLSMIFAMVTFSVFMYTVSSSWTRKVDLTFCKQYLKIFVQRTRIYIKIWK